MPYAYLNIPPNTPYLVRQPELLRAAAEQELQHQAVGDDVTERRVLGDGLARLEQQGSAAGQRGSHKT